jgi:hypothetical protein
MPGVSADSSTFRPVTGADVYWSMPLSAHESAGSRRTPSTAALVRSALSLTRGCRCRASRSRVLDEARVHPRQPVVCYATKRDYERATARGHTAGAVGRWRYHPVYPPRRRAQNTPSTTSPPDADRGSDLRLRSGPVGRGYAGATDPILGPGSRPCACSSAKGPGLARWSDWCPPANGPWSWCMSRSVPQRSQGLAPALCKNLTDRGGHGRDDTAARFGAAVELRSKQWIGVDGDVASPRELPEG